MDAERWRKVRELFDGAVALAPDDVLPFLKRACTGDAELRAEVESLLAAHRKAGNFIEASAVEDALNIVRAKPNGLEAGARIGRYKLISEIGRGGMGAVYLAERADDEYKKRVALKLIKRGMDTDAVLARFRAERQILAQLEHPFIARLLDGGTTDDHLPFIVMEYVEGAPITKYADHNQLSINERLKLFRKVCAAVSYAHQNLIIHRDIKPSNILVNEEGTPKLLDFGIAKLLDADEQNETETATALRAMTPEYASPEQVRGARITTAADTYSLGVVLYELLTGARPLRLESRRPDEIARAICEQEPERPSTAISLIRGGEQPERPRRRLAGELDNIILMALRKEPERRYKSVEQFSEDIRRYLEGLPITARKDTFTYRASKFVRRNRLGVTAATLILLAVVGGLIATAWQARVAARERDQARVEKVKAEETRDFLERMLSYSNPIMNKDSRATTISDVLDEAGKRLEQGEFANQPEIRAELELSIGKIYARQARFEMAYKYLPEAAAIQNRLYGENHPRSLVANAYYASILFIRGAMTEAEKIFRHTLPLMREEQRKGNIKAVDMAYTLNNFAYLRRTQGDSKEAESLFREALTLSPLLTNDDWRSINGTTRSTLASTLADQGKFDEALQTAREAVAEDTERGEADTPNFGFALTVYGGFLTERGDYAEADARLHEAETIFRKTMSPAALWLGDNLRNQAISLYQQGKYGDALDRAAETLNIYRTSFGTHYDHYPTTLIIQGLSLTKLGQPKEGEQSLREAVKLRTNLLPKEHYWVALARSALGEGLMLQGRYAEAEPLLLESYDSLRTSQGANNPRTGLALRRLIALYESWGRPDEANRYRNTPGQNN